MFRFKRALMTGIKSFIAWIICFLVSAGMLLGGFFGAVEWLMIVGGIATFTTLIFLSVVIEAIKDTMTAICPECQHYVSDTDKDIEYSYECDSVEESQNNSGTSQSRRYTWNFTCKIICPNCGNTIIFPYRTSVKNATQAEKGVIKYIKHIISLPKKRKSN